MSKGTVTGGGTDGKYNVTMDMLDGADVELSDVYCADLTDDLTGNVGLIAIAGDRRKGVNILPGHAGGAAYNATRDGEMKRVRKWPYTEPTGEVYWNWAMRAGWQRWRPNYRYGTITHIYSGLDTCDLTLDACYATDVPDGKRMSINPADLTLGSVEIEYMDCDSAAFVVGDRVIVQYENNSWDHPKVIGFVREPNGCFWHIVLKLGEKCTVWDILNDQVAENVYLDADHATMATFPCNYADISDWIAARSVVAATDLFVKVDQSWYLPSYSESEWGGPWNSMSPCPPGSPNDFGGTYGFLGGTIGEGVDENLWGFDNTKSYDYTHDDFVTAPCETGTAHDDNVDEDTVYSMAFGFTLDAQNGSDGKLGFWQNREYTEENRDHTADPFWTTWTKSEYYFYTYTWGNGAHPGCEGDSYFSSEPAGAYGATKSGDQSNYASTPWTLLGDDSFDKSQWSIGYAGHYSEDEELLTVFLVKDKPGSRAGYAAIGDVHSADPSTLAKHAGATTALQALVDVGTGKDISATYLR